ncbi:MAG TPA: hypothetical protein VFE18_14105 [Phenylobacterium sp.]|jgi:hypothetical protein|uniref:hypothetical protein n=1 Tax=Phenylobacterium sp. TaxID=1871053 RepID=UPI002D3734BD|nr:hypothetical protein [Phenylobacterium sp.]HZZ69303.1 hypothetical protein [Phenylobacterium sp.]
MLVTAAADTQAQASTPKAKPLATPPDASAPADGTTAAPSDSVSLSPTAQQALTDGTPAPAATDATPDATPAAATATTDDDSSSGPSSADLQQAAALLNNVDGTASVTDQIGAFALITNFIADASNLDPPKDPATAITAGAALYDSTFAKHQQALLDAVNSRMTSSSGASTSASVQDALNVFNGFSTSDQQIYLGAVNLEAQQATAAQPPASNGSAPAAIDTPASAAPAFASSDSYRANLQARIDVKSTIEAASASGTAPPAAVASLAASSPDSDAWTAQAQAYFAANGPAPPPSANAQHFWTESGAAPPSGVAMMTALIDVDDDSGRTPVKDQLAAFDLLTAYGANSTDAGPARAAVLQNFNASPFAKQVAQVDSLMNSPIFAADVGGTLLDRIDRLTPDDQQIAFHEQDQTTPGAFASLNSLKANDTARSAITQVTQKIFAKFGGDDLTKLTDPRLVNNPAFQELLTLTSEDPESDGWTAQANQVLSDIAKGLDLVPDDPHATDAAKALATLKAPPPVDAGTAMAMKTFKHIGDQLQQVRDDNAPKLTGQPARSSAAKSKAADKSDATATSMPTPVQTIYSPGEAVDTLA